MTLNFLEEKWRNCRSRYTIKPEDLNVLYHPFKLLTRLITPDLTYVSQVRSSLASLILRRSGSLRFPPSPIRQLLIFQMFDANFRPPSNKISCFTRRVHFFIYKGP